MQFYQVLSKKNRKQLSFYCLSVAYVALLVYLFPLIIDYLKTYFFLKNYQLASSSNIVFFTVVFLIVFFVSFPFVTYYFVRNTQLICKKNNLQTNTDKKKALIKIFSCIFFYCSFIFFVLYSLGEISYLKKDNHFYQDSEKLLNRINETATSGNLQIYIDHIPFLFRNAPKVKSRIFPVHSRVVNMQDLVIITDCSKDYFYLNSEGLLFTKISDEVGLYTNSNETIEYLTNAGYKFSNGFVFEKEISISNLAKQNGLPDYPYLQLKKDVPVIFTDQYEYGAGNYELEVDIEKSCEASEQGTIGLLEFHFGNYVNKIFFKDNEFSNNKLHKVIPISLNSIEQDTFISIISFINSELMVKSIKLRKI
ncbi:hypothetical protein SAMN02910357_02243 [Succinivibrio dextrinosolvens]|uniref:hypothetical protein n=1 Tax=Succinivibrio dextrinosolvens TaxID=83771 RepID=UPI0008EB4D24|nr:hypothetical protein [Succinivibrio dextrinosolvens]SFS85586.1 hypothetical protein SAMN02910357_02243 [Succinivibrio dextrinosolvens]